MQNEGAARHPVHGFVEKSCGGRQSQLDRPSHGYLDQCGDGHFKSLLTFQRNFSQLVLAVLCAFDLEILTGRHHRRGRRERNTLIKSLPPHRAIKTITAGTAESCAVIACLGGGSCATSSAGLPRVACLHTSDISAKPAFAWQHLSAVPTATL